MSSESKITHDKHVTQLVQPEPVNGLGDFVEVSCLEGLVDPDGSLVELVEHPSLCECLIAGFLQMTWPVSDIPQ